MAEPELVSCSIIEEYDIFQSKESPLFSDWGVARRDK
jgi:hypothetical protein